MRGQNPFTLRQKLRNMRCLTVISLVLVVFTMKPVHLGSDLTALLNTPLQHRQMFVGSNINIIFLPHFCDDSCGVEDFGRSVVTWLVTAVTEEIEPCDGKIWRF